MTAIAPWYQAKATFDCDMLLRDNVLFVAAIDGSIRALDVTTGVERWATQLRGTSVQGLALSAGTLYATIGFTGRSGPGVVYALNAASGATERTVKAPEYIATGPAIANGILYFGTAVGSIVERSGSLYSFDTATGALASLASGFACAGTPVISGDDLFIASEDASVRCIDRRRGGEHWRFKTRKFLAGTPAVAGDTLLVGSFDHSVYALDLRSGAEWWCLETGGPVRGTPVSDGETVFVASYDESVYAVDAASGRRRWSYPAGSFILTTPTLHGDLVIVGCSDGSAHAVHAHTGKSAWVWRGDDPMHRGIIARPVVVAGGNVVLASRTGTLHVLDLATGHEVAGDHARVVPVPVERKPALETVEIGEISLPSGRIVVCDPVTGLPGANLERRVRPGAYRVSVGLVTDAQGMQSVAWICLRIASGKVVEWKIDPGVAEPGVLVDSGTAAIMSAEAAARLAGDQELEVRFGDEMEEQMNASYGAGRHYALIAMEEGGPAEAAVCFSGAGDGAYACSWGLDRSGRPVSLKIDFGWAT
jgi:outer membrane protein assembly factor BamB